MTKVQLHLHPYFNGKNILSRKIDYFDNYSLEDLINTAEKKGIGVLGLERLNYEIYPDIIERTENLCKLKKDDYMFNYTPERAKILNKRSKIETIVLRATEYRTKENFDILVIGYSGLSDTKGTNSRHSIYDVIDKSLENKCLLIMDHSFCNAGNIRKDITKGKEKELKDICRTYLSNADSIFMEQNNYCIPWLRKIMLGGNVNKKLEKFVKELKEEHNIDYKIISDMDGHLRYKGALNQIEKGAIEMNIDKGNPIVEQIKNNVNKGEYRNNCRYVTPLHFAVNMGIPYVFHKYFRFWINDSRA